MVRRVGGLVGIKNEPIYEEIRTDQQPGLKNWDQNQNQSYLQDSKMATDDDIAVRK